MRNDSIYMNIPVGQDMCLNREARYVDITIEQLKEHTTVYQRLTKEEDRRLNVEAGAVDILMELVRSIATTKMKVS